MESNLYKFIHISDIHIGREITKKYNFLDSTQETRVRRSPLKVLDNLLSLAEEEEVDFSTVIPINNRLSLVGKLNYSFNNNRSNTEDMLEKMFGFEYESCCYGIKFVVRDYWNGTKKDNAFYLLN